MRRFSQRTALVTLSDINITPLLDLAFVLLIIFVITTPLLEQSIKVQLPSGGKPDRQMRKEDFRTVEISPEGAYFLQGRRVTLAQAEQELLKAHRANPKLAVSIRADRITHWEDATALIDMLVNRGITRFNIQTAATRTR